MPRTVAEGLASFQEADVSVRVCRAIFSCVPIAPEFVFYRNVEGALSRLSAEANADVLPRAEAAANSPAAAMAVRIVDALDTVDASLAMVSGVRNVLSLFGPREARKRVFEADSQQAVDAALKLFGLAYVVTRLFEGDSRRRLQSLLALPAGREATIYYAVAEVSLPFADNLMEGGSDVLSRIFKQGSESSASQLAGLIGRDSVSEAAAMAGEMTSTLQAVIGQVRTSLAAITGSVQGFLPTAMNAADSITGAVATGLDVMPIWRFLGSRLTAEACAWKALAVARS